MKHYIVEDLQGADFMGWTRETPVTKNEFRSYLFQIHKDEQLADDDPWDWRHFTAQDGCEIWELGLVESATI